MELFSLRCFVTVARLGSFSRAAEALLRTQPAVSLQIRKLEQELGRKLFDRAHRSPVMTEAGRTLAAGATDLLERLDMLPRLMASSASELSGSLTIASNLSLISHFLPRPVREFHRRFPRVRLRLLNRTARGIGNAVEEREADMGIGFLLDDRLEIAVSVLDASPFVLVTRPDSPTAAKRRVSVEEILAGPLIHFEEGVDLRRHLERTLLGARKLEPIIELPSIESILEFVSYGFGASILPSFAVSPPWRKKLVVRGLGRSIEPLTISSCVHRRHPVSRAASAFLALIPPADPKAV